MIDSFATEDNQCSSEFYHYGKWNSYSLKAPDVIISFFIQHYI